MPEDESWRPVLGWEGSYEISDLGRVKSLLRGRELILKGSPVGGYLKVGLYGRGNPTGGKLQPTLRAVSGLVAEAFLGPRPEGLQAAHQNGVRTDNRSSNLKWKTPVENAADKELHGTRLRGESHPAAKLTAQQVDYIRKSQRARVDLARSFGVSEMTIYRVRKGLRWRHTYEDAIG